MQRGYRPQFALTYKGSTRYSKTCSPVAQPAKNTGPAATLLKAFKEIDDDRMVVSPGVKSILIIEDDPEFAKILLNFAHENDFKALITCDGETGLQFADYYRPSAIILDISLPGMDGWAVMEKLKDNPDTRNIPVHFITASEISLDALKMGAIGYLTKPVNLEMLDRAFKNIEDMILKKVKKLLVVEDDESKRKDILELIDGMGIESSVASSGKEAYECLKAERFDCMSLNPWLVDGSGLELLEKIRGDKTLSTFPIIIYTSEEHSRKKRPGSVTVGKTLPLKRQNPRSVC